MAISSEAMDILDTMEGLACGMKTICRWKVDVVVKGLYTCKVLLRVGLIVSQQECLGKSKDKERANDNFYTVFSHADFYTIFNM